MKKKTLKINNDQVKQLNSLQFYHNVCIFFEFAYYCSGHQIILWTQNSNFKYQNEKF